MIVVVLLLLTLAHWRFFNDMRYINPIHVLLTYLFYLLVVVMVVV